MNALRTAALLALALPAFSQSTLVVVTKDGQRHSFPLADVARIEFGSNATPPPPPPQPGNWLDTFFSGKVLSGDARQGSKVWPFRIKVTSYTRSTGAFAGEIVWTSLGSTHRIQGQFTSGRLYFTETEAIRAGAAHLRVAYTLTPLTGGGAKGMWTDPADNASGEASIAVQ